MEWFANFQEVAITVMLPLLLAAAALVVLAGLILGFVLFVVNLFS